MHHDEVHSQRARLRREDIWVEQQQPSTSRVPSKKAAVPDVHRGPWKVFQTTDVGPVTSHFELLSKVASQLGGQLQQTVGAGHCFFDAVRIGLLQHGVDSDIPGLRRLAGAELRIHFADYGELYEAMSRESPEQSATYSEYVQNIEDGCEWATELTVCAMVHGLDRPIRVIKSVTDPRTGQMMCFQRIYEDGVTQNAGSEITVFLNSAEAHYLGWKPGDSRPMLPNAPHSPSQSSSPDLSTTRTWANVAAAAAASPPRRSTASKSPEPMDDVSGDRGNYTVVFYVIVIEL